MRDTDFRFPSIDEYSNPLELTNSTRKVCFEVMINDDTDLEQSEWATLSLHIFCGTNTSVVHPLTNILILDNDSKSSLYFFAESFRLYIIGCYIYSFDKSNT